MFVGVCRFTVIVAGSHSLKEKRVVLRRVKDRVRAQHGVTLAEVAGQDTWQRADLAFALVSGERDRIVIKALMRLARELGLTVLVEGVESTAQLKLLCEWGCDLYQGFVGAGALTQDELLRFVAAAQAEAAA